MLLDDVFLAREIGRWAEALERSAAGDPALAGGPDVGGVARLERLGVSAATLPAFTLAVLVEVAWSDGDLDEPERAAVLAGAEAAGLERGSAAWALLETWLAAPPPAGFANAVHGYWQAVAAALSVETRFRVREQLIGRARAVAEASGGFLGMRSVSSDEEAVLERIDADFGL